MAERRDPMDGFAGELADALRTPAPAAAPRRRSPTPSAPPPVRTTARGPRRQEPAPDVLRNRSFSQLFGDAPDDATGDAWAPDPPAGDGAPGGATVVLRDDPRSGLLELHAGAPGPAGEASIELQGGLTISVDAAAPRRLTSIVIDRHTPDEVPSLGTIVHPMLDQLLGRGAPADGEWHTLPLRDPAASDLDTIGRFILLADEAEAMPVDGPASEGDAGHLLPQAALLTEAITRIPRSLRYTLGPLPTRWARRAAALLVAAEDLDGLHVPDEEAAHELANGARAASQVLSTADGPHRLHDRRLARQVGALADRLVIGPPRDAAGAAPARSPDGAGPLKVLPAPALRDRYPELADQVVAGATVTVLGPGEIEVSATLSSRRDAPPLPADLWARVTRRSGGVPLALTPLAPATVEAGSPGAAGTVVRGRALLPLDLSVGEVLVDITDDPGEPVPTAAAAMLDVALTAGRAACRHERRSEQHDASRAWERCADAWSALGDEHRATVARRYAAGAHAGQVAPFLADRLR